MDDELLLPLRDDRTGGKNRVGGELPATPPVTAFAVQLQRSSMDHR